MCVKFYLCVCVKCFNNSFVSSWLFVILILMYAFIVLVHFLVVKWILMLIMYSAASL